MVNESEIIIRQGVTALTALIAAVKRADVEGVPPEQRLQKALADMQHDQALLAEAEPNTMPGERGSDYYGRGEVRL